jgi:hypothetical protein
MSWQSPLRRRNFQKIRTTAYAGFEKCPVKMLSCKGEPVRATRIHLQGAGIHITFTSLTLASCLRCRDAADSISRTAKA